MSDTKLACDIAHCLLRHAPFAVSATDVTRELNQPYGEVSHLLGRMVVSKAVVEKCKNGIAYYTPHSQFVDEALASRIARGEIIRFEKMGLIRYAGSPSKG